MKLFSINPFLNSEPFVNEGPTGECLICGEVFNQSGPCKQGHIRGETYFRPATSDPVPQWVKALATPKPCVAHVRVCAIEGGSRCSICRRQVADSETMCSLGHHLGATYVCDTA